jgi:hypothetical protein
MVRLLQPKTAASLALVATLLMADDGVAQQHPRGRCHAQALGIGRGSVYRVMEGAGPREILWTI